MILSLFLYYLILLSVLVVISLVMTLYPLYLFYRYQEIFFKIVFLLAPEIYVSLTILNTSFINYWFNLLKYIERPYFTQSWWYLFLTSKQWQISKYTVHKYMYSVHLFILFMSSFIRMVRLHSMRHLRTTILILHFFWLRKAVLLILRIMWVNIGL